MSLQVILLWIAKYPSQLLTVRIRIQLNWAKRYEIEESCATNCCFWAWFWNYNILSFDTATQEPACTYLHKLDSPQGSVTLTLQMDVTPKFLRTHTQSLKQGFSISNVNEPCRYQRSAPLSFSLQVPISVFFELPGWHTRYIDSPGSLLTHCRGSKGFIFIMNQYTWPKMRSQFGSSYLPCIRQDIYFQVKEPSKRNVGVPHDRGCTDLGVWFTPLSRDWSVVKWVFGTWLQFCSKGRGSRWHHYTARGLPDFKVCHHKFFSSKYDTKLERKQ